MSQQSINSKRAFPLCRNRLVGKVLEKCSAKASHRPSDHVARICRWCEDNERYTPRLNGRVCLRFLHVASLFFRIPFSLCAVAFDFASFITHLTVMHARDIQEVFIQEDELSTLHASVRSLNLVLPSLLPHRSLSFSSHSTNPVGLHRWLQRRSRKSRWGPFPLRR